ncbi:SOS response-associated peptidase [Halomonas sp. NO4]|uniref:SOS response-associated peptidase n=1 Tax=Halomonas sp. NO4 TaxID=2484813 RepID=UPI0013D6BEF5|nr:SOS response-associated peptidase [Halomonas sp. NO4]
MCGRFALYSTYPRLTESLRLPVELPDTELSPRYNVAPGTWISAVRHRDESSPLVLDALWWGYRPHWAGESAPEPINATVEKVASSRYFRGAFAHHRCLVPVDGWYEWMQVDGRKQPHYLTRQDGEPLWLAAIWADRPDGKPGCAILTEPARGAAKSIHDRMPLVLDADSLDPWLDPHLTDREAIRQLVDHLDSQLVTHWPVSTRVNRPVNDDPSLTEPVSGQ